ncbi:MAG: hypothetical protein DI628_06485 [Blastochloris viridis]|uniref:Uncharacterized protein n=1 Tax=Blastochloris viridis TaxID=1079 RepID=A0A6N4QYT3_BLAVI|nr:MAG: hypothetical protein DI628_06485 [Blastochloris viridis]
MKWISALGFMAAMALSATVHAQTNECVPPEAGLAIAGAVTDFKVPPSAACRGPNYASSLGPIIDYNKTAARPAPAALPDALAPAVQQRPRPNGPVLGAGDGVDLYDLENGTGGTLTNYNGRELERLGELDAMQGRPLNMDRASDVNYLKGYTRGSERRMAPKPWR